MHYDVLIAGGGPAGLSASLALGRARRGVLLADGGPRRNAAAAHVHNFVTRDGITPDDFRRIGREQLAAYPSVQIHDARVDTITGSAGDFSARLENGLEIRARRVLLCAGMIDEPPAIDGMEAFWGTSVFQCPYCHGWEIQDRRFAYLARSAAALEFAILLRSWTASVTVLTGGSFTVPEDLRTLLSAGGVTILEQPLTQLQGRDSRLTHLAFADGTTTECDALFLHPPQRPPAIVAALGLALDDKGYVRLNDAGETSVPGVAAAGDLVTPIQSAVLAAASGMRAAARLNLGLSLELATSGGRS